MVGRTIGRFQSILVRRGLPAGFLCAVCAWSYWPALQATARKWREDPQYAHGYLVPVLALVLAYVRRPSFPAGPLRSSLLWIPLLVGSLGVRYFAELWYLEWLQVASFVTCLAAIVALLGGRPSLRWAAPSLAFLLLAIPLPDSLETLCARPLQRVATQGSVYVLRACGLPALAKGHVIVLGSGKLGVEQACNGLSMLLIFLALVAAVVAVSRRPLFDRVLMLASALPIAILANVARITVTGITQELYGREAAQNLFHDWAGLAMMPLALALLGVEMWLLRRWQGTRECRGSPIGAPSNSSLGGGADFANRGVAHA